MRINYFLQKVIWCLCCFPILGLQAEEVAEYELKAAYLYNFALFTQWPIESNAHMVFCVFRQDPITVSLEALQGKKIQNRPIAIKRIDLPEEAHACDVMFLGEADSKALPKVLEVLNGSNTLTVTDSKDLLRKQMAINLAFEGKRLIFEVNLASARRAKLTFSSKLLNLAKSVD